MTCLDKIIIVETLNFYPADANVYKILFFLYVCTLAITIRNSTD